MITVARGVAHVRSHYESSAGDLMRVILNAASNAEANLALGILEQEISAKDLVTAVNLREVLRELPVSPFLMGVDMAALVRLAGLEKVKSAWRCDYEDVDGYYGLAVLGDGNLCYDVVLHADGRNIFLTPSPSGEVIVRGDALDLLLRRETMLHELVCLVKAMGIPFTPRFYLSLEDWMLQYAEDTMEDLYGLF
jgi:hypothetical protein